LPVFVVALSCLVRFIPVRLINLPDREYWLAPERSDGIRVPAKPRFIFRGVDGPVSLFRSLAGRTRERSSAADFPETLFIAGFILFLVATMVWLGVFVVHFRRRP
jgi:hypothetical protein